jgi:hypothetical protein
MVNGGAGSEAGLKFLIIHEKDYERTTTALTENQKPKTKNYKFLDTWVRLCNMIHMDLFPG